MSMRKPHAIDSIRGRQFRAVHIPLHPGSMGINSGTA